MLNILTMIILIIILFIIIFLYIGIKISINYKKTGPKFEGFVNILILKRIKIYSIILLEDKSEDKDFKKIYKLSKPFLKDFKIFLNKFLKCVKVESLENHVILGLTSYSDTVKYIGYIWIVSLLISNTFPNAKLSAEPCFTEEIIDFKGKGNIKINLLKLIKPTLELLSKKEIRKFIRDVKNEL